jgi:short-subunit dehydrogenase
LLLIAIRKELAKYNINVQLLSPMNVDTSMIAFVPASMKGNIFTPNVKVYAKSAVAKFGKCSHTTGYWSHGIQVIVV